MIEVCVELRGGPVAYTTVAVYRDNAHQLPPLVEVVVTGGVLEYKLTSGVTASDGYPIYRCPTNWRLAVRPAEAAPSRSLPSAAPAEDVDPLDALLAELDAGDAEGLR